MWVIELLSIFAVKRQWPELFAGADSRCANLVGPGSIITLPRLSSLSAMALNQKPYCSIANTLARKSFPVQPPGLGSLGLTVSCCSHIS